MAQLLAKNQTPPTKSRANQFGTFARDPNHQYFTQANYPYFEDATTSAVTSPVSLTTGATLINIPAAAATITLIPAVAIRVSDTSDMSKGYAVIPANTPVTLPVVTPSTDPNNLTGQMWLAADSTNGACSFFFSCV